MIFFWSFITMTMMAGRMSGSEYRKILVVTVATNETEGYKRFQRSCQKYKLDILTLGMGQRWQGPHWKLKLFTVEMENLKEDKNAVIMFSDSYATIAVANQDEILAQFDQFKAQVVFGADNLCLSNSSKGMGCLNPKAFIGKAKDVYNMLISGGDINNNDDDKTFFTKIFLEQKINIKLDEKAELFQNLHGATHFIKLRSVDNFGFIQNTKFNTRPKIILGNGATDPLLNHFSNYIAGSWNQEEGCIHCQEETIDFDELLETPKIVLAIFIEKETPFMLEFWRNILSLEYEKSSIDVYIHNSVEYHKDEVESFRNQWGPKNVDESYNSIEVINHKSGIGEQQARNRAVRKCMELTCDYLFVVDSDAHLDNTYTLQSMIEQNRNVVGPLLATPYFEMQSNFWNVLQSDIFEKSIVEEYIEIAKNNRRGLWNVQIITSCYLINGNLITNQDLSSLYTKEFLSPDMALSQNLKSLGEFLFISNRIDFGHLVNTDHFNTNHKNNELWEIKNNKWDWEKRYIHPDYAAQIDKNTKTAEPCPDVFNFPVFTERFCVELIDEVEKFGLWITDPNDELEGLPTRDAHMYEIHYEEQWLYILEFYIQPLQQKVFLGYDNSPPESVKSYVIRYRPTDLSFLSPHHDTSTYSITLPLNKHDIDYEGGGINFLRQGCKIISSHIGWMLMFPGTLTHFHEGLPTTKGTRYVMVSFIDP